MKEVWKPIRNHENFYLVSNLGRIKRLSTISKRKDGKNYKRPETILKPYKNSDGYLGIRLYKDGKSKMFRVHRIVAEHFIPNPDNKPCIDHVNTIRTDNRVENLRWVTPRENMNNEITLEKFNKRGKSVICIQTGEIFNSATEAEDFYKLRRSSVADSANPNNAHKYAGKLSDGTKLQWKYLEEVI